MEDARTLASTDARGVLIPLAAFTARLGGPAPLRRVLAALTVTEKVHAGRPRGMGCKSRKAYAVAPPHLVVPRARLGALLAARTKDGRPLVDGVAPAAPAPPTRQLAPCEPSEPLYGYQEAAVAHVCGLFDGAPAQAAARPPQAAAYLQMDTGLGKSRVGLAVAVRRGAPALVVVPTEAIGFQWVDEAAETYPDLRVALYRNPTAAQARARACAAPPGPATHDVVVVIVNTFRDKAPDFLAGYGLVILDEAHELHSEHNSRALWLSEAAPAVLGLSATPVERPDGLDRYVSMHLGPVILPASIPGFDARSVCFRGEVTAVEYAGRPDFCETAVTPAGTMSAILTIGNLCRDAARTRLVASLADGLYRRHATADAAALAREGLGPRPAAAATARHPAGAPRRHGVFVFAEHREMLPAIRDALAALGVAPEDVLAPEIPLPTCGQDAAPVSILRGGVAREAVGAARAAGAHIVLTTYGFSRRGISLPDMTAIVLATPRRNNLRQILGRILRRGSDESIVRQVVDIVDVRTGLRGQFADRRKIYAEKGYPVAKVRIDAGGAEPPATEDDGGGPTLDELMAGLDG